MKTELLTVAEMARADRLAIESGPFDGFGLMKNAGRAVVQVVLDHDPGASRVHVFCGPGNNGGDGYVAALELVRAGREVELYATGRPRPGSDAERAASLWKQTARDPEEFAPREGELVIDAIYGAGLARELDPQTLMLVARSRAAGCRVVAVDLPSGIEGDSGRVLGDAFAAEHTVTFFRKKPGHLLYPGRAHCGRLHLADIGIPEQVLERILPACHENLPQLWKGRLPAPSPYQHKYSRGAVGVFSGPMHSTGAGRLAAMAAQRAGAGAVTLFSPPDALAVNAAHLTSIMLSRIEPAEEISQTLEKKRRAYVLGPGFGVGTRLLALLRPLLAGDHDGLVLDADAITSLAGQPDILLAPSKTKRPPVILTPHVGEFARLFPDLASEPGLSRLQKARQAARMADAVLVLKGPDTVIAAPDGRAAINANATSDLATAGSGDVLAGIAAALLAQKVPAFEAACAAVWLHAEAGRRAGRMCIAEDLPLQLPAVFARLSEAGSR